MVCLDEAGAGGAAGPAVERHPLGAGAPRDLVAELGGPAAWAGRGRARSRWRRSPSPSCAGCAEHEPEPAAGTAAVCLPHDWLTWRLPGHAAGSTRTWPPTDRGDACGHRLLVTGHAATTAPTCSSWRWVATSPVPRGARSGRPVGGSGPGRGAAGRRQPATTPAPRSGSAPDPVTWSSRSAPPAWCSPVSDVPAARPLGRGGRLRRRRPGSSFRWSAPSTRPGSSTRPQGCSASTTTGSATSPCRLPPAPVAWCWCPTSRANARRTCRTSTGALHGLTLTNATAAHLARAAVEGMLCGLADGVDALVAQGARVDRVLLVGGGAASRAVRAIAPQVLGRPVDVPQPGGVRRLEAPPGRPRGRSGPGRTAAGVASSRQRGARRADDPPRDRYAAARPQPRRDLTLRSAPNPGSARPGVGEQAAGVGEQLRHAPGSCR